MFLCSVDGQQQTQPCFYPVPSSSSIALLAVWCQPNCLESEEFCKQESKWDKTIPCLLGYVPAFYTSTIHVLSWFGVSIPELVLISSVPISSHLAFLPRTSKITVAMLKVCLFMHLPEAWKYGHAHFFWSLMCVNSPIQYPKSGREAQKSFFTHIYHQLHHLFFIPLLSRLNSSSHNIKSFLKGIYFIESQNKRTVWIKRDLWRSSSPILLHWAGIPSTIPWCSELHLAWPWTFAEIH